MTYDHLPWKLRHKDLLALLVYEDLLRRLSHRRRRSLVRLHGNLLHGSSGGSPYVRLWLLLYDDDRFLARSAMLLTLGEQHRLLQLRLWLRLLGYDVRLSLRVRSKDVLCRLWLMLS